MNVKEHRSLLRRIIDVMREAGLPVESPYDFDNWVADHATHTDLFATGCFDREETPDEPPV